MKKYYKALLFGSIGTLVETSEIQRKSFNEAFKKKGLDWYWTKEEYTKLLSKSGGRDRIKEYAKKKNTKVNAKQLRDLKTKLFNNYLKKSYLKLRPGVKSIINICYKEKIRLAFVTSTSKNNVNSILFSLRKSISQKNFSFIGNSKLVKNLKPNPDIYILALKKLKLKPKECLAIEDSQESLNSAVNAKIKCIIFPGKFHLNTKFKNAYKKLSKLNKKIIVR